MNKPKIWDSSAAPAGFSRMRRCGSAARWHQLKSVAFTLLCCTFLAACTASSAGRLQLASEPAKEVVIDDLKSPWGIAFLSDAEALITEKEGRLVRVNVNTQSVVPIHGFPGDLVADIGSVRAGDNSGLFDVVIAPDYADNRHVYVAYSAKDGDAFTTKVIRAELRGDRLSKVRTILTAEPFTRGERYHYGGGLLFGADGKLYVTIGERLFSEEDQPSVPIAQDLSDRRGKIYRLNPDGSIPDDNPDFGRDAIPGLYAIGIRAAQGLALHPVTAEIWFTEHGTHQGDEINRLTAGANYGWPVKTTGKYRYAEYEPPEMPETEFTAPEWFWLQTVAPTGPVFYQGEDFPGWENDLIVPGLSRGSLWRVDFERDTIVAIEELFVNDRVRARKIALSPDGKLYLLTDTLIDISEGGFRFTGEPSGQLIRIVNKAVER